MSRYLQTIRGNWYFAQVGRPEESSILFTLIFLEHVQILAALALAVVQADLVQYLPGQVQAQGGLASVQLGQVPRFATLTFQLLVAGLAEPNLLEHAHQELVHVVLHTAGRLDELAFPRCRQQFPLCEKNTVFDQGIRDTSSVLRHGIPGCSYRPRYARNFVRL